MGHEYQYYQSCNVIIDGVTIIDCWGDCIYVGSGLSNVKIRNRYLSHARKQRISVNSADGVTIKSCIIADIEGIGPQYAIDTEPNKG